MTTFEKWQGVITLTLLVLAASDILQTWINVRLHRRLKSLEQDCDDRPLGS